MLKVNNLKIKLVISCERDAQFLLFLDFLFCLYLSWAAGPHSTYLLRWEFRREEQKKIYNNYWTIIIIITIGIYIIVFVRSARHTHIPI